MEITALKSKLPEYFAYLYTDRPIYRPGQTVNFKGILRKEDDAEYSLPPDGQSLITKHL